MSTLQVHITAGPQTGARLQLNQPPATFGRSAENTLVLDLPVVSRQHGELTIDEQGRWVLINHSQNGTRVGRKNATKKPIVLTEGASIVIGDTEVFRVHLPQPDADDAPAPIADDQPAEQTPARAPGAGLKGRSKLWIGIGAWILFLAILVLIFSTGDSGNQQTNTGNQGLWDPGKNEPEMPPGPDADYAEVLRLLSEDPPPQDPNATRFTQNLDKARIAAKQGPNRLFDAYDAYQKAIAYSDNRQDPFPDRNDLLDYERIKAELATIIAVEYRRALLIYKQGDHQRARDIADALRRDFYSTTDPDDALASHIRKLRSAAHQGTLR